MKTDIKEIGKRIVTTLSWVVALAVFGFHVDAQTSSDSYQRLESKAKMFFDNKEWASANAMYLLMMDQKPTQTPTYAKSVVVNIMMGDTVQAVNLLPRALDNEISIDSLLHEVRNVSFSLGKGNLYENYLLQIRKNYPWFSRVADNYLMKYYSFRQNGPELIRYAAMMLKGLPDNIVFMRMLAKGYMLTGNTAEALSEWLRIVEIHPDNYETILDLANFYDSQGYEHDALKWMKKAYELRPSPYIGARLNALSQKTDKS